MTQPHAATYTPSGGAIYAGRWVGSFAGSIPLDAAAPASSLAGIYVPSWVPATAWQWTDVPGTNWGAAIKMDGTGIAPAVTANDPGPDKNYIGCWAYSGPCYSRKRHEFWMFGGGHADSTINILTKVALNSDSPSVSMPCAPTTEANRRQRCLTEYLTYAAQGPRHVDGKPYSPHAYWNNLYLDASDEFISFALQATASSADGSNMTASPVNFLDVAAFPRDAANWSAVGTLADLPNVAGVGRSARVVSADGTKVYYWADSGGLRVYNRTSNTHSTIGGTATAPSEVACNNGADTSLHVVASSASGWQVKTCDLSTGVQTTISVSGDALPTTLSVWGLDYVDSLGAFVVLWVNADAYNGSPGAAANNVTTLLVTTLAVTGSSAVATNKTMTGTGPTHRTGFRGVAYDPTYNCVLLMPAYDQPIKCFKVS